MLSLKTGRRPVRKVFSISKKEVIMMVPLGIVRTKMLRSRKNHGGLVVTIAVVDMEDRIGSDVK